MNKIHFWIGVASKDHVQKGATEGFCQLCHGKSAPLKRLKKGDWIIYYSPKEKFGEKIPYQKFTAIGKVVGDEVYAVDMGGGFIPYRKDVEFYECNEVEIKLLLEKLSFIQDKKRWGYSFRFGYFQINECDFQLLYGKMLKGLEPSIKNSIKVEKKKGEIYEKE
jgi:hypothetical protein